MEKQYDVVVVGGGAAGLAAGSALDVGSGEGADALWLAEHGWAVTGAEWSATALERAAAHAAQRGPEVAGRVTWLPADLTAWAPPTGAFDLVTAHFMHLPEEPRRALFERLADAVAPGGTLLIVGHSALDRQHPDVPGMFWTAEEVAASLDRDRWEVLVAEDRPRTARDPEGREVTLHDAVLRVVRAR